MAGGALFVGCAGAAAGRPAAQRPARLAERLQCFFQLFSCSSVREWACQCVTASTSTRARTRCHKLKEPISQALHPLKSRHLQRLRAYSTE